MNINDTQSPEPSNDRLVAIFRQQEELKKRYHEIELKNKLGLGSMSTEFSFDDAPWQYLLKDYAWRVSEELAESTECSMSDSAKLHKQEEAIDALHFLVELFLIVGISPEELFANNGHTNYNSYDMLSVIYQDVSISNLYKLSCNPSEEDIKLAAYAVVECLGKAMNCLKNKPWKSSQMSTDVGKFKKHLCKAFDYWMAFAQSLDMDDDVVYDIYFRKAAVNEFRQKSNY